MVNLTGVISILCYFILFYNFSKLHNNKLVELTYSHVFSFSLDMSASGFAMVLEIGGC